MPRARDVRLVGVRQQRGDGAPARGERGLQQRLADRRAGGIGDDENRLRCLHAQAALDDGGNGLIEFAHERRDGRYGQPAMTWTRTRPMPLIFVSWALAVVMQLFAPDIGSGTSRVLGGRVR